MAASSEMQFPSNRFAQYTDELHELGRRHQVPCGTSEDLARFSEAFRNSEGFAADFRSLIRHILLRENRRVSESQLLTLVLISWGGENSQDPIQQLPSVIRDIRYILRDVQARIAIEPSTLSTPRLAVPPALASNADNTEIEEINPFVRWYRRLFKVRDRSEAPPGHHSVSVPIGVSVQNDEAGSTGWQKTSEILPIPRLQPSGAEILALGLVGLVVALLFNVGSMPVYRARISVLLPSAAADAVNPLPTGLQVSAFQNGGLTETAAERLLALPHQKTILRQDAFSRGMRDLHLGGSESILYAELVAETAQQVKIRQLQPTNSYEITCDSWSSQFAATFCNELITLLDEQPGGALSSQPGIQVARPVDAAPGPGIQIYPHWYLSGVAGLVGGSLAGVLVGFIKRPIFKAMPEKGNGVM